MLTAARPTPASLAMSPAVTVAPPSEITLTPPLEPEALAEVLAARAAPPRHRSAKAAQTCIFAPSAVCFPPNLYRFRNNRRGRRSPRPARRLLPGPVAPVVLEQVPGTAQQRLPHRVR
ncbi:hypothetical protein GCM10010156_62350 [Planobispora rosea]|nr:hypothetical protein GCM10010156_62350 [Planobispora rosea]